MLKFLGKLFGTRESARRKALKITLIYALIGSVYILVSDKMVNALLQDSASVESISILKGWMYVFATAVMIFLLVYPSLKKISDTSASLQKMNEELRKKDEFNRAVMDNLPIGIAVNSVFPEVSFVYMNDRFPLFYQTSRVKLETSDVFWDAVYEDADFREKMKRKVLEDIASGDPARMHWENVPITRNGITRYISAYGTPVPGENLLISTVMDVTKQKKAEESLVYFSYHDHLTDLYNRRFFENELRLMDEEENLPITIVVGDVNGLKLINDSFGHEAGDQLLKKTAEIIKSCCRPEDIIARTGGDEFAIVLQKTDAAEADRIIEAIRERVANTKLDNAVLSVSFGSATKHLTAEKMRDMIAEAENSMYKRKMYESASMRNKTIDVIMNALFEKSEREMQHSKRVSALASAIAGELGLGKDEVSKIKVCGLVHDIGKIGIDEKILNKTDKLEMEEWTEIKKHPESGWRILASVNEFSDLAKHILSHHERWDGQGYPRGLRGEEITLEARIIALADAYDAMTKDRPYRKGMSKTEAIEEIRKNAGAQFDPGIVEVFIDKVLLKVNDF